MYDLSYPVIFVVCDSEYIKYLRCFLFYLNRNTTRHQVFIHFINVDQKTIDNIIQNFPAVKTYSNEHKTLNKKNNQPALPPFNPLRQSSTMYHSSTSTKFGRLYSDKISYCANIRARQIKKILSKIANDVIYIDVDNIVNKDLEELYKIGPDADLSFVPAYVGTDKISTTLIYIKNSNKTIKFFTAMSERVEKNIYRWGIDHIVFNELLNDKHYTKQQLPEPYYDELYNSDSVIWINHLTMYGSTDKYEETINEIHFRTNSKL